MNGMHVFKDSSTGRWYVQDSAIGGGILSYDYRTKKEAVERMKGINRALQY